MLNNLIRPPNSAESEHKEPFTFPSFVKQAKMFPSTDRILLPRKNRSLTTLTSYTSFPKIHEKQPLLEKRKKNRDKPPVVSAKSWIVYNKDSSSVVLAFNEFTRKEIASLSKVMTCIVVIESLLKNAEELEETVQISYKAATIEGTSAGLAYKDHIKVVDLLFALMLPSGNDAAIALAEHFGSKMSGTGANLDKFVKKMNGTAKTVGLKDTLFKNPHGMSTSVNFSTAFDLALLSEYGLKMGLFRKVVNCEKYSCEVVGGKGSRMLSWTNTNKLLKAGFCGVKTGFTPAAGPCLVCACGKFIIVLLGCSCRYQRWKDSLALYEWVKELEGN